MNNKTIFKHNVSVFMNENTTHFFYLCLLGNDMNKCNHANIMFAKDSFVLVIIFLYLISFLPIYIKLKILNLKLIEF